MKYATLLLTFVCVNSYAQFAPERIQSGLAIVFPADKSAQTALLVCLNRMNAQSRETKSKTAGLHGLHLLSRVATTPDSYHQLMLAPLLEISKTCVEPSQEPDSSTVDLAKYTNVLTFPRGGKISRNPQEIELELCINMNQVEIGIEPRKIQSLRDLSLDEKQKAMTFCKK